MHVCGKARLGLQVWLVQGRKYGLFLSQNCPSMSVLAHHAPGLPAILPTVLDTVQSPGARAGLLCDSGVSMWLMTLCLSREQQQQLHFQNFGIREEGLGFQKDWGDGPRNENILKHKSHDLSTVYPYGDPELMDYDTVSLAVPPPQGWTVAYPAPGVRQSSELWAL